MSAGDRGSDSNDQFFRVLCETCGVGFWHIDTAGRTVYLNQTMCTMLELASPSAIGDSSYHRFFTADSLQRMRLEHQKRAVGETSTYEADLLGDRGGRRNVVISGAPYFDAAGQLAGVIGTFTDITDRKRAELALRESENQLRSLFAASVDAIGVSLAGRHLIVNPAYLRMFGYSRESELITRPIFDLIAPSARADVLSMVHARSTGNNPLQHYVTRGLRSNGEEFPLEVHVSGYEQGGDVYTVAILRDITEQQHLEEQLRQSQKMDALGRLAGGVAHDFNNLLMVMMGCAELIAADARAGEMIKSNAELIHTTGERAVALTRQLLALSRRQVIDPSVIDLNRVVTEMTAMLQRLIGPRVALHVASEPELGRIRVDPGQIQQVLMNLCVNARDALPNGGQIVIGTENVQLDEQQVRALDIKPGAFVRLSVSDNGVGIDSSTQQRMFEPFFTTKALGEGTGLGLSTVYGIVKQSGGHVAVNSTLGEGSTISVYLPIVDGPLAPPRSETSLQPVGNIGTVLLVDDEAAVRLLVQNFLESAGYGVLSAADGREAIEVFKAEGQRITAVVTDMLMPGLSGLELARSLDQLRIGELPILFMSGYAHDGGAELTERPGSAFLAKPFGAAQLAKALRALLSLS